MGRWSVGWWVGELVVGGWVVDGFNKTRQVDANSSPFQPKI